MVEKALEAEAFRRNLKGRICHHRKWNGYAKGAHVPQKRLEERVELQVPGSAAVLNHPIWRFRDLSAEQAVQSPNQFLSDLSDEVRERLFRRSSGLHLERKRITHRTLAYLESRLDLCGLAALAMIVLEASAQENKRLALDAGCALFRALLRLTIEAPPWLAVITTDLFELFRKRVFPSATDRNSRISLDGVDFPALAKLVRFASDCVAKRGEHPSQEYFLSRLFDHPWMTPLGYLMFIVPMKPGHPETRAGKELQENHSLLLKHWAKAHADLLKISP